MMYTTTSAAPPSLPPTPRARRSSASGRRVAIPLMRQVSDAETVKRERVDCCKKVVSDFDPVDGLPICPFHGKQPRASPPRHFKIPKLGYLAVACAAAACGFLTHKVGFSSVEVLTPQCTAPKCASCPTCPAAQCAECMQCTAPKCADCPTCPALECAECPQERDCTLDVSSATQKAFAQCQSQLHSAATACESDKLAAVADASATAQKLAGVDISQNELTHAMELRSVQEGAVEAERRAAESASFAFTTALIIGLLGLWLVYRERQNRHELKQQLEEALIEVARLNAEVRRKDGLMTQALETLKEQAKVLREEHSFEVFNLAAEDATPAQFVKAVNESVSEIDSPLQTHRPTFSYTPLGVEEDKENSEPVKRRTSLIDREAIALERHLSRLPRNSAAKAKPRRFSEK